MPRLLTIPEAAEQLGVPPGSLRTAAERNGLLVKIGRAVRIDPNDIQELIKKCRDKQKDPASTAMSTGSGTSATTAECSNQRALETAEKLKGRSRDTLPRNTGRAGQLHQIK